MLLRSSFRLALVAAAALIPARTLAGQIPDRFTNLQVLSGEISRDSLIAVMRRFSLSLGVRCQFCHLGGDGVSFAGVDFARDGDPDKAKARFMLRMVDSLNRAVMPRLPGVGPSPVRIECKTCHRGSSQPLLLTQRLERTRDSAGIEAAVAEYRKLRDKESLAGRWDFQEWEINLWAEELAERGDTAAAVSVYRLNLEYFPRSLSILRDLGRLHESRDRGTAIDYYRRALTIRPDSALARRVDSLARLQP